MAQKDNESERKIRLTPEQEEMVRRGIESLERGEKYTAEEVRAYAREKVKAWLPKNRE